MLLVALAHASSYTDTLGSAVELSAGNGHNDGTATVFANIFEVTTSVDLTGVELYAKENDADCTNCDFSPRLWTYDAATGTWSTRSLGATLYVGGASYAWETATITPTRLEAGTTYAIGFWADEFT